MLAALALAGGRANAACTVSIASNVAFGTYNVFNTAATDSTGTMSYRCSGSLPAALRVTITTGSSSTYLPRTMSQGSNTLAYNLYRDSARSSIWGDGTQGTSYYSVTYPGSKRVTLTIYGRVPASQDVSVGSYSDSVTVVVNY